MMLYCDNEAAIAIAKNHVQYDRTKHMEVDRYFIKDHLNYGTISLPFITSQIEMVNILKKTVSRKDFHNSLNK